LKGFLLLKIFQRPSTLHQARDGLACNVHKETGGRLERHTMRYRVTFLERTDLAGKPSEVPPDYLEIEAPEGVILDKTFLERDQPLAMHNQEILEEDDSFLSVGSETWDYEVADGR